MIGVNLKKLFYLILMTAVLTCTSTANAGYTPPPTVPDIPTIKTTVTESSGEVVIIVRSSTGYYNVQANYRGGNGDLMKFYRNNSLYDSENQIPMYNSEMFAEENLPTGVYTYQASSCYSASSICSPLSGAVTVTVNRGPTTPVEVIVRYEYDALGRLVKVNDPLNGNRNYHYDAAGNRTSVQKNQ